MALITMNQKNTKVQPNLSVNEFLKIKDIRGDLLYTTDGYVLSFLKIYPQNTRLKTYIEQARIALNIASQLSTEKEPFALFLTNKPVDVSKMTDYQAGLMLKETDPQKQFLLQKRLEGLNVLSNTGIALELEIYLKIWARDKEGVEEMIARRKNDLMQKLLNANFRAVEIDEKELQQLCDSYTNPDTTNESSQYYI